MEVKKLTCIECPIGCDVEVTLEKGKVASVKGNSCPRGKSYAENEVVCPKRVVTSSVRAVNGEMVSVKTDNPIPKTEIFSVMEKINKTTCSLPVKIGDVLVENISDGVNLVATTNME